MLLLTLGLAFLGGLVLNLMPCVLPVLTIKAAGLVHTAHDPKQSRAHGLAYLAGVVVCFAAIGAMLVALKAAGDTSAGLGFQLQYAWVTAIFALVMFAVGLNLLGVFEIGGSLMGIGGKLADRGGTSGAFFTGLLAAFVGAPCVGPFMAPARRRCADPARAGGAGHLHDDRRRPGRAVRAAELHARLREGAAEAGQVDGDLPAGAGLPDVPDRAVAALGAAAQAGADGVIAVLGGAIVLSLRHLAGAQDRQRNAAGPRSSAARDPRAPSSCPSLTTLRSRPKPLLSTADAHGRQSEWRNCRPRAG